jgi:ATP-dependent DNA ligase
MEPPEDRVREPMPEHVVPMLARLARLPADEERWAYEIKWDGIRAIAFSRPGRLRLESRNLIDITARYPELRALNRALSHHEVVLDGEIVARRLTTSATARGCSRSAAARASKASWPSGSAPRTRPAAAPARG